LWCIVDGPLPPIELPLMALPPIEPGPPRCCMPGLPPRIQAGDLAMDGSLQFGAPPAPLGLPGPAGGAASAGAAALNAPVSASRAICVASLFIEFPLSAHALSGRMRNFGIVANLDPFPAPPRRKRRFLALSSLRHGVRARGRAPQQDFVNRSRG
jgi:hypothetical protein